MFEPILSNTKSEFRGTRHKSLSKLFSRSRNIAAKKSENRYTSMLQTQCLSPSPSTCSLSLSCSPILFLFHYFIFSRLRIAHLFSSFSFYCYICSRFPREFILFFISLIYFSCFTFGDNINSKGRNDFRAERGGSTQSRGGSDSFLRHNVNSFRLIPYLIFSSFRSIPTLHNLLFVSLRTYFQNCGKEDKMEIK